MFCFTCTTFHKTKIIGRRFWERLEAKRDRIQRQAAKNGGGGSGGGPDANFRDVMKFLAELSEEDREAALNVAMESAVDAIEGTFQQDAKVQAQREIGRLKTMAQTEAIRHGSSGGSTGSRRSSRNPKMRRSSTTGSSASRGSINSSRSSGGGSGSGSAYRVDSTSDSSSSNSSRAGLGGSLMKGGKSWKCRTCGR